jgi:hypothetical protein
MPSFCVQQHDRERDGPFPRDFGDGKPQYIFLPPGMVTLMVKRVVDQFSDAATLGFEIQIAQKPTA